MTARRLVSVLAISVALVVSVAPPADAGLFSDSIRKVVGAVPTQVLQTLKFSFPKMVIPRYSFCNAQVCGTSENLECVGNQYIPGFLGDFARTINVSSIGKLVGADMSYGQDMPSSGGMGGLLRGSLSGLGKVLPEGFVLNLPFDKIAAGLRDVSPVLQGLTGDAASAAMEKTLSCGVPEEQKTKFVEAFPDGVPNDYANIVLKLLWDTGEQSRGGPETFAQTLTLNGAKTDISATLAPDAGEVIDKATVFDQTSSTVKVPLASGKGTVSFAEVGSVATVVSSAFTLMGLKGDPEKIGEVLRQSGSWRPGEGTNVVGAIGNAGLLSQLATAAGNTEPTTFVAGEVGIVELAQSLSGNTLAGSLATQLGERSAVGSAAIFAWAPSGTTPGGAALFTAFDATRDEFEMINSVGKRVRIDFESMARTFQSVGDIDLVQIATVG